MKRPHMYVSCKYVWLMLYFTRSVCRYVHERMWGETLAGSVLQPPSLALCVQSALLPSLPTHLCVHSPCSSLCHHPGQLKLLSVPWMPCGSAQLCWSSPWGLCCLRERSPKQTDGVLSVPCLRHGLPLALRVKNTRPFETCHLLCLLSHFTSQPSPQPQDQALLLLSLVSWMRSSVSVSGSLPLLSCSPPCFQHPLCTLPSTT